MNLAFEVTRFAHYAALLIAFGASLFPYYGWPAGKALPELAARTNRFLLPGLAAFALLTGAGWFAFVVNNISDSTSGFLDPATVLVVLKTDFGRLWVGRAVVMAFLLGLAMVRSMARPRNAFLLILSALALASLAGTGHTQSSEGFARTVLEGVDGLHLLAAGAWSGGLVLLALVVTRGTQDDAQNALSRFSSMGYLAVAALLTTGATNALVLVGSWGNLFGSSYGRLLLGKISIFFAMVAFAGVNRFFLLPALVQDRMSARGGRALARFQRNISFELLLGFAIVAIVSALGMLSPPAATGTFN